MSRGGEAAADRFMGFVIYEKRVSKNMELLAQ